MWVLPDAPRAAWLPPRPAMRPQSRARDSGRDRASPSARLVISLSAWWKMFAFREVTLLSRADLWRKQDTKAVFGSEAQTGPCPHSQPRLHLAQGPHGACICLESSLSPVRATPSCAHTAGCCPVVFPRHGIRAHFGGQAVGRGTGTQGTNLAPELSGWSLPGSGLKVPRKVGGRLGCSHREPQPAGQVTEAAVPPKVSHDIR